MTELTTREQAAIKQVQDWLDKDEPGFEAVRIAFNVMQRELDEANALIEELER